MPLRDTFTRWRHYSLVVLTEEACFLEIRLRGGDLRLFLLCPELLTITKIENKFIETIHDCYLHQHIQDSTRRHGNDEPSSIDLLFTDEIMQVSDIVNHALPGKSEHSVITFKFNCYLDYSKPKESYVYEKADFHSMKIQLEIRTDTCIYNISEMVRREIVNLNVYKACGPDEINPRLLIELVDSISRPIALLLNETMKHGEIPKDWKLANVSPIYKKGAKNRAENCRPVSLTYFVKEAVMNHTIEEKLLSSKQYGFISGRSTTTQLLRYLDKCIETIIDGGVDLS